MYLWVSALLWIWPLTEAKATNYSYNVCIQWEIETVDSSFGIDGGPDDDLTEDYYQGCDTPCVVTARGVRFKVAQGTWRQTLDANPTTGCAIFTRTDPPSHSYDITVYAYATDANDNFVRMHDEPSEISDDNDDYYPGATISQFFDGLALTAGGGANFVPTGGSNADWTGMAAAAFTLYRYHDGLSDSEIHIGSNSSTCQDATAHYDGNGYSGSRWESNSRITRGQHYIRLGTCATGGTPYARMKFAVAHEMGHAIAALYYGSQTGASNFTEPNVDDWFNNDTTSINNYCEDDNADSYSMFTKEWNAVSFREGFAHFVAARVWNDRDPSGAFRLFSETYDLERYGPSYNGTGADAMGGLLIQVCDGDPAGASTNDDYLRFLWDFYTADSGVHCTGGEQPTNEQMLKLYAETRLAADPEYFNYSAWMRIAALDVGFPSCLVQSGADEYDDYEEHNGLDY